MADELLLPGSFFVRQGQLPARRAASSENNRQVSPQLEIIGCSDGYATIFPEWMDLIRFT